MGVAPSAAVDIRSLVSDPAGRVEHMFGSVDRVSAVGGPVVRVPFAALAAGRAGWRRPITWCG
jgi:hypothetical protein